MVLVFFVVNLLRIDLYDVVKEIKKGRDTMKTIIKRSILDYLKNPVLWIGLIIIVANMYQCLSSYLQIHYIKQNEQITQNDVALEDADVMDGYIPTSDDKERRREWEDTIKETLMDTSKNGFGFSRQEADHVMKEIQNMDVKTASEFLESQYGYYNAIYAYEDLEIHKGTAEEINHYIERKLSEHSFFWYFAKKFTDFAGLHMAFFATVLLSFLFIQDTRKSTYELLHTKPVTAIQYICGKVISGFISMLGVLVILSDDVCGGNGMIHTAKQLKDKVKNMSGGNSEVAQALIRTYFMERFLERVSVSEYRNNFILKGVYFGCMAVVIFLE